MPIVRRVSDRSAAKVVRVIANNVPEVSGSGSLEMHRQELAKSHRALEDESCTESVLHVDYLK